MTPRAPLIAALALMAGAAHAQEAPRLGLPVDCTLGDDCYIQQYHDADPGPGAQDYMCDPLSYDGHKGTDIALPSRAAMARGVTVIAAAPGIVLGMRDGMADRLFTPETADSLNGQDCGNGVLIDHGGGWHTQYCHMAKGSVTVAKGDKVTRGAPLGKIGLSGRTQFPHLHLSLRKDGEPVDPFRPEGGCGAPGADSLWITPPEYRPGGIITAGLSIDVPDFDAVKAGEAALTALKPDAPSIVVWGHGYGARQGDIMQLQLKDPDGRVVVDHAADITRQQAQYFRAAGKRARSVWPTGTYHATVSLMREGDIIDTAKASITVE